MDNKQLGRLGERIAVNHLRSQGYKILETNFYKRWGEIDIVAIDPKASQGNDVLVFIEVKTRMVFDRISPEESITPRKISTLKKTALFYQKLHSELPQLLRIDFVGIAMEENLNPVKINLIKNISS